MQLNHVGIINKSEEQAVKFYQDFLGFKITREIILPLELTEQLFSVSKEIKVLVVENEGIKIEVFISDFQPENPNFTHLLSWWIAFQSSQKRQSSLMLK